MGRRGILIAVTAILLASIPSPAAAGDKEKAKEHFLNAKALVEEGAYDKAIIELKASYDLNPMPVVLYNLGICYDELHKYARALKYFNRFLVENPDAEKETFDDVTARIGELQKFIGTLAIDGLPAGAGLLVDGEPEEASPGGQVFLETGEHQIEVKAGEKLLYKEKVTIISGETRTITVTVKSEKPTVVPAAAIATGKKEKKERKKLGPAPFYSMIGLAGGAALCAILTGVFALEKEKAVSGMYRDEDWKGTYDEGRRLAIATDALVGVAAAAAVAAIGLAVVTDFKGTERKKASFTLAPAAGGGLLTIEGTF